MNSSPTCPLPKSKGLQTVLIGSALPSSIVGEHRLASAAAARWQLEFAAAIASEFDTAVHCLSLLPVAKGERASLSGSINVGDDVTVTPITWSGKITGVVSYSAQMLRQLALHTLGTGLVFCYNPTFWTAPWAVVLSIFTGAPMVMIVADVAESSEGSLRSHRVARLERALLKSAHRFLLVSPATRELLPAGSLTEIFPGLADSMALSYPQPTYSERVRFVFAGATTKFAGIEVFLSAAAQIGAENSSCEFHIFGRGSLPSSAPGPIQDRTFIHGFVSDDELNTFMGDSCVGVNPRPDPHGMSRYNAPSKVIHYLSRGLATITTITPGVAPELASVCIVAGEGIPGLTEAMRTALKMLPSERQALGERARIVAAGTLSSAALAARIQQLLRDSSHPLNRH